MALITCPECKASISDRAPSCPHCGLPLNEETLKDAETQPTQIQVTLVMAKQTFLISPTFKVIHNNNEVAWLGDGQITTIMIPAGENTITFAASLRKRVVHFNATKDVTISVKWNRLIGTIEALCTGEDVQLL